MYFYFISMITALFGSAFFLIKRKRHSIDWILVFFNCMVFLPALLGLFIFRRPGPGIKSVQFLTYLPLLFGPLFFIYVDVVLLKRGQLKKSYLLHFIPFLVVVGLSYIFTALDITIGPPLFAPPKLQPPPPPLPRPRPGAGGSLLLLRNIPNTIRHIFYSPFAVIQNGGILTSLSIYMVLVIRRIRRNKEILNNFFSFKSNTLFVNYIIALMGLFLFIHGLNTLSFYFRDFLFTGSPTPADVITSVGEMVFIVLLNFFSIKLENDFDKFGFFKLPKEKEEEKYKTSPLDEGLMNSVLTKISGIMIEGKYYRNCELTLEKLADEAGISRNHISQTINHKLQKNFYQYVNELRLQEFIKRLKKGDDYSDDILSLAIASGFNSKSAFYAFFKKEMNMTPVQYRKQLDT